MLHIYWLHIHDVNLQFYHISKLYWIEIWLLCGPFECSELIAMLKTPALLHVAFSSQRQPADDWLPPCSYKGINMGSDNTQKNIWYMQTKSQAIATSLQTYQLIQTAVNKLQV